MPTLMHTCTSTPTARVRTRKPWWLLAVCALDLLAACSSSQPPALADGSPAPVIPRLDAQATAERVTLSGCVAGPGESALAGVTLQALDNEGRLLAIALSDAEGRFFLRVPTRHKVRLEVLQPTAVSDEVQVGTQDLKLSGCFGIQVA